jgi:hypothetical protein
MGRARGGPRGRRSAISVSFFESLLFVTPLFFIFLGSHHSITLENSSRRPRNCSVRDASQQKTNWNGLPDFDLRRALSTTLLDSLTRLASTSIGSSADIAAALPNVRSRPQTDMR